jgi:hypothetical protein
MAGAGPASAVVVGLRRQPPTRGEMGCRFEPIELRVTQLERGPRVSEAISSAFSISGFGSLRREDLQVPWLSLPSIGGAAGFALLTGRSLESLRAIRVKPSGLCERTAVGLGRTQ